MEVDGPLNIKQFSAWTSLFAQFNSERVLRIKALVCAPEQPGYLAFDAIRAFVHPATMVPAAPHSPRRSIVVFIVQDFSDAEEATVRTAIAACTQKN